MCRYCVKYGDGHKWYLNPKNYTDEVTQGPQTKLKMEDTMVGQILGLEGTIQEIMTTAKRFKYDIGFGEHIDEVFPDLNDEQARELREGFPDIFDIAVGGQVVPLEDAEKIIDLNHGDIFVLPCICRKYYGGKEKMSCMFLNPAGKLLEQNTSWDTPNEMVSKEKAKEMVRQFDKENLIHGIFWCPAPVPIMLCNCEYPHCIALRARLHYNLVDAYRKGEYVAFIDAENCDGCNGIPACINTCTFGSLKYSPTQNKVIVDEMECYGCGLCRNVCPNDAISLIDREKIPQIKDDW